MYVSSAAAGLNQADLLALLSRSRDNNLRLGITGMLLYKDGSFLQLLEGERPAVRKLFEVIKADPRHHGAIVLLEQDTKSRAFEDWSMGFRNLSDDSVHSTPGYSWYMNTPLVAESFKQDPSAALRLLSLFKPAF